MKIMTNKLIPIFIALQAVFFNFSVSAEDTSISEKNIVELYKTVEGVLLVQGWDEARENDYDASKLSKNEIDELVNNGVVNISQRLTYENDDEFFKFYSEVLARHYLIKKSHRKKMYWSIKAAEKGSSFCMRMLSDSYRFGEGAVQDLTEGVKWIYLGAAAGDEWCQKWVQENGIDLFTDNEMRPFILEAQKRARDWSSLHPEVFISCN